MVNYQLDSLDLTFAALAESHPPADAGIAFASSQMRVTDLAEPFAMSLPAVSKHLRVLEKAGLLKRRRLGREHHLELEPAPMKKAHLWIEHYRKFWEGSLDSLADYLENNQPKKTKKRKKT